MKSLSSTSKKILSILFILSGCILLFFAKENFKLVNTNISVENAKYKTDILKIKKENNKSKDDISDLEKKLNKISNRRKTMENLVSEYDYETNKYDDYISYPMALDYNVLNIKKLEAQDKDNIINSFYFNDKVRDLESAKSNLLISSILQNDYLIREVNYNLLRSNFEAYKYNGILKYYNTTTNYFLKSKVQIESKDRLMSLYQNMIVLKILGLEMLDHLTFVDISDQKEIDLQNIRKQMNNSNSFNYSIPQKFTESYYNKLLFGTDVYCVVNSYSKYVNIKEKKIDNGKIKIMQDFRGRIHLISELKSNQIMNYYYDTSGKVYKVVNFSDGIETIDFNKTSGILERSVKLYKYAK